MAHDRHEIVPYQQKMRLFIRISCIQKLDIFNDSTMSVSPNAAAWLTSTEARPLCISPAPLSPPSSHELLIKNAALAINPIDWHHQHQPPFPLQYPAILGHDIAGVVVAVGSSVVGFQPGDRVLAHAMGMATQRTVDGGFQLYTIVPDNMTAHIPHKLTFEQAATIPLALSTAAAGLFQPDYLALEYPKLQRTPQGSTLLVLGGASNVGLNAIQLANAAGYEVITTASPKNFSLAQSVGAEQVFDYQSPSIVEDLVAALQGKKFVGAFDTIHTDGALQNCVAVVERLCDRKFVSTVWPVSPEFTENVTAKFVFATTVQNNDVGKAVYNCFLPQALEAGKFVAASKPRIVGKGLEAIQTGIDEWKKGISAEKIVAIL